MLKNTTVQELLDKVKQVEKGHKLDLSAGEDLSIAVMNLISIEEHLFFSGGKTGERQSYDLIEQVRTVRKQLMKMLVKNPSGETWCISKHLLAASMRIMEVATKSLTKGDKQEAHELFDKAYQIYTLFWGLNLGLMKTDELKSQSSSTDTPDENKHVALEEKDFIGKITGVIGKVLDCCKE